MVLPLQPFAYSWLGGSGELLGGSEGGPEGARGRSRGSPRATFRASKGSLSGLGEICCGIVGSSDHLGSWLQCRGHDSSGLNRSSECSQSKSERSALSLPPRAPDPAGSADSTGLRPLPPTPKEDLAVSNMRMARSDFSYEHLDKSSARRMMLNQDESCSRHLNQLPR